MAADTIVYTLETRDLSTGTVNRIEGSYRKLEQEVQRLRGTMGSVVPSAQQLERQMSRLTTLNGLLFEGLRRVNSLFAGMAFGTVIGAFAGLTTAVIEYAGRLVGLADDQERFAKAMQETLDRASDYERFLARLSASPGKEVGLIESRAETIASELDKINNEIVSKLAAMQRTMEQPLGFLRGPVIRGEEEIRRLQERAKALREELTVLQRLLEGRTIEVPKQPSAVALGNIQVELATKIQNTSKAIRDSELGLRTLEVAFSRNITLQAAYGHLAGAAAVQQQYGNQIIQHTVSLQAMGGVVLANYLDLLARGVPALEAYRKALADANNEQARGTLIAETALTALQRQMLERATTLQNYAQLLGTLSALASSQSRALFLVGKAAAVGQAVVSAYAASNLALAQPPGPPTTIPLAASVLKWGLANAALAAAVQLSTGFGGGGAGGLGGSGTQGPISDEQRLAQLRQQRRDQERDDRLNRIIDQEGSRRTTGSLGDINITNVYENLVGLDQSTIDRLTNAQMEALGQLIEDRNGDMGNIKITYQSKR